MSRNPKSPLLRWGVSQTRQTSFHEQLWQITSVADHKRLIDNRRGETRKKHAKKVLDRSSSQKDMNSLTMKAIFAYKEVHSVCADGSPDNNLIPTDLFPRLTSARGKLKVSMFKHPRKFGLAAASNTSKELMYIRCDLQIVLNTERCTRHGKSLMLRNLAL